MIQERCFTSLLLVSQISTGEEGSQLSNARLRMEKRHNYVRKTAELAAQFYINPATSQPIVAGLILACSADFKTELSQSDVFDSHLQAKILNVVDVSYGGDVGHVLSLKGLSFPLSCL